MPFFYLANCRKPDYILVYNEDKTHTSRFYNSEASNLSATPSLTAFAERLGEKAGIVMDNFDLLRYEKMYFKCVNTYTKAQFQSKFVEEVLSDTA